MRAPCTNPLVWKLQVTCKIGADEGTQHESARLTVAGLNQRTARSKAKRTEHLPCHTAPAKMRNTNVQQWSTSEESHETKEVVVRGAEGHQVHEEQSECVVARRTCRHDEFKQKKQNDELATGMVVCNAALEQLRYKVKEEGHCHSFWVSLWVSNPIVVSKPCLEQGSGQGIWTWAPHSRAGNGSKIAGGVAAIIRSNQLNQKEKRFKSSPQQTRQRLLPGHRGQGIFWRRP